MREAELEFSVVIPTHNRAHMIARALRSVEAQTFPALEMIVVDDGSTDDTSAVLSAYRSSRLRVLHNIPARGASSARNRGVAVARGQFVVFLDDDDELRPDALQEIGKRVSTNPSVDFLWGRRVIHTKDKAGRTIDVREDDFSGLAPRVSGTDFLPMVLVIATSSAFTIRRSAFETLGGFDETLPVSEDRDLFLRLAEHGHVGAVVDRPLIDINEHLQGSLSRSNHLRRVPDTDERVMEKHRAYLELPENRGFRNRYLLEVLTGYIQAGMRGVALRRAWDLMRHGSLDFPAIISCLRHTPELRALKSVIRYDSIRRLRYSARMRGQAQ